MGKFTKRQLAVEPFEERLAPATFGVPWPDARHLTLSFAPDGTAVGDRTSALFGLLDASMPRAAWQGELLRAAQAWAAEGNLNIALIEDAGVPFGARGPLQGDPDVGDIRFSAVPMAPEIIAIGTPYDLTAGTWAGDIRLNSNYHFGLGQGDGQVDLFTVALHELGHALGLDHDHDDPASAMHDLIGVRSGLTASDVTALRALYGPRPPDEYDAARPNETLAGATRFNLGGGGPASLEGDLTTAQDVDTYEVRPAANANALTVRLRTAGVSLLAPRLAVFDRDGAVVQHVVAAGPGGDLAVTLPAPGNTVHYVQVGRTAGNEFGVGAYHLTVEQEVPGARHGGPPGAIAGIPRGLNNDDRRTNDTFASATPLMQRVFTSDPRWDYTYAGSVGDAGDVDYYRIKSPGGAVGSSDSLTISLWGVRADLDLRATVFTAQGQALPAEVLVNDGDTFTLQLAGVSSHASYVIRVSAAPGSAGGTGNYFFAADFGSPAVELPLPASGALDAAHPHEAFALALRENQLFHLLLGATAPTGPAPLRVTVEGPQGEVLSLTLPADGTAASANLFLAAGTYTFRFFGGAGGPFAPFLYTLHGVGLSDPIGPRLADTTTDPVGTPPQTAPAAPLLIDPPTLVLLQEAYSDPLLPITTTPTVGPLGSGLAAPRVAAGAVLGPALLTPPTAGVTGAPAATPAASLPADASAPPPAGLAGANMLAVPSAGVLAEGTHQEPPSGAAGTRSAPALPGGAAAKPGAIPAPAGNLAYTQTAQTPASGGRASVGPAAPSATPPALAVPGAVLLQLQGRSPAYGGAEPARVSLTSPPAEHGTPPPTPVNVSPAAPRAAAHEGPSGNPVPLPSAPSDPSPAPRQSEATDLPVGPAQAPADEDASPSPPAAPESGPEFWPWRAVLALLAGSPAIYASFQPGQGVRRFDDDEPNRAGI